MDTPSQDTRRIERPTDELRQVRTITHYQGVMRPAIHYRVQRKWIIQEVPFTSGYLVVWDHSEDGTGVKVTQSEEWRDLPIVEETQNIA